ncbi:hypothetical protein A2755_03310 [Candidatus Wolfebacteria bacterium RIFCSPHIGHO2_01_FULL_48_22]|uniref:Uncharacterized protein n=2 Tax=Candidatus Wolfeibacteriota TaxID=1752735 RepID=A0A1F8DQ68_9BACT|nr:MAG: hypothetical protein A2755_03310 [Candidatus Wolfebacteria bacterium RIFCSPHIGHO2_01_FULL_48_22]OGM92056.1 MAG: hypothetical protein A2935_01800 [Candidatus Wolfebacteria bacterium RIFCSPLOWO2_01_FULL_47_17b]
MGVAKGSVSVWVRNVSLTPEQKKFLSQKNYTREAVERRRQTRLKNENARREIIIQKARSQISPILKKELWLIGSILYWAEGGKTRRDLVRFSNSDPEMIRLILKFFRKVCNVSEEKIKVHVHIHPHLDHISAEKYWSHITKIPLTRFYKTYRGVSKASKQTRQTLPYGTCDVYIASTELFLKIYGWVQGIFSSHKNLK